jgi:hypothetical protein
MTNYNKFKPIILDLIKYYYDESPCDDGSTGNSTGGYCHIALDDGNLSDENLYFCQEECLKHNDGVGYLIATILRHFTEDERDNMYEGNWKEES